MLRTTATLIFGGLVFSTFMASILQSFGAGRLHHNKLESLMQCELSHSDVLYQLW